MKMFKVLILMFVILCSITSLSFAITVDELLKDPNLDAQTREKIVQTLNKSSNIILDKETTSNIKDFADVFSDSVQKICRTLNVEVNEFIKTDVGKLTAFLIAYKVAGKDFIRIIIYLVSIFFITIICFSFIYFTMFKKKVKNKETGEIKYVERFDWEWKEAKLISLFITACVWIISFSSILYNII